MGTPYVNGTYHTEKSQAVSARPRLTGIGERMRRGFLRPSPRGDGVRQEEPPEGSLGEQCGESRHVRCSPGAEGETSFWLPTLVRYNPNAPPSTRQASAEPLSPHFPAPQSSLPPERPSQAALPNRRSSDVIARGRKHRRNLCLVEASQRHDCTTD